MAGYVLGKVTAAAEHTPRHSLNLPVLHLNIVVTPLTVMALWSCATTLAEVRVAVLLEMIDTRFRGRPPFRRGNFVR